MRWCQWSSPASAHLVPPGVWLGSKLPATQLQRVQPWRLGSRRIVAVPQSCAPAKGRVRGRPSPQSSKEQAAAFTRSAVLEVLKPVGCATITPRPFFTETSANQAARVSADTARLHEQPHPLSRLTQATEAISARLAVKPCTNVRAPTGPISPLQNSPARGTAPIDRCTVCAS